MKLSDQPWTIPHDIANTGPELVSVMSNPMNGGYKGPEDSDFDACNGRDNGAAEVS